ncbi:phenol 2-monooxygenase P4 subunit [Raineyella antarctica]|uniref:Phenol 2-monooxygenase P4 subunit n=1 Tax=Raineyella antarctica TaxID=1577474 RepID=A0A1G6GHQ8_9ACTN|nr:phenol hydroxylase subunit P4 [Raineyella antarctica]SDB81541.1 phenol 2-monooxygenase P4 subunit [Raineyella antarctica]
MTFTSTKEYVGVPRDSVEHFRGEQLVYIAWHQHLLFAAPFMLCVPPQMTFGDLVHGPLTMLIGPDPDAAAVDWDTVVWTKGGKPFSPDPAKSLAENGIDHKSWLRFETAGLNSLCGV